ncbi:MAG: hypothetical protein IIB00_01105 [candidate division Zixibacteria bacterium]|nr:hypothetical protein [candidate division Zixibacteria bacterium]
MERIEQLRSYEVVLESFLERMVNSRQEEISTLEAIGELERISEMSMSGHNVGFEVNDWLSRRENLISSKFLNQPQRGLISGMLLKMQESLPDSDTSWREGINRFAGRMREKESGAADQFPESNPESRSAKGRTMVLKRGPEKTPEELSRKFASSLTEMVKYIEGDFKESDHLLSRLDNILKSAAVRGDKRFLRMGAALIYFLKTEGYKVEPYVKKLREAEKIGKNAVSAANA